jgi:hypothetical protein
MKKSKNDDGKMQLRRGGCGRRLLGRIKHNRSYSESLLENAYY